MSRRLLSLAAASTIAMTLATSCSFFRAGPQSAGEQVVLNPEKAGICRKEGESCISKEGTCCSSLICTGVGKSFCTSRY